MKQVFFLTLTIVCLFASVHLEAQQYSFRHYSVNEGLVQSDVNRILQDRHKYIWIATNGGVSRFDGLKIKNYKIPISQIAYDISEGDQGEIFVLMNKGIGIIRNDSILSFPFAQDMQLDKCRNFAFKRGKLWMITNLGITFFDGSRFNILQPLAEIKFSPVWFCIDKDDVMWIESSDRKLMYLANNELKNFEFEGLPRHSTSEIQIDQQGDIYGICGKKLVYLDHFDEPESNFLQKAGDCWYFSSINQVYRKHGKTSELIFEAPDNDRIRNVFVDSEQRLWIGTQNGFYYIYSLAFKKYFIPEKLGNEVWGIVEDNQRDLWFTSFGKGLTKYDGSEFTRNNSYHNILNTDTFYIGSIKKSNGNLLFATTKGILQFDGNRFSKVPHIPAQIYMHIYEDVADNTMIYAGDQSLVIQKRDSVQVFDNLKYHLPHIFNVIKDRDHIYRMGGAESTVFFDGDRFLKPDTSKFGYTKGMYSSVQDSKGNLWIATRYGIMLYDYKTCRPVLTSEIQEAVFDLKMYFGKIYFGTIKGVGLIDPDRFYQQERSVRYFDYKNGYPGEEVVQNGAIVARDSSIWIPATRGVTRFLPARISDSTHISPVMIDSIFFTDPKGTITSLNVYGLEHKNRIELESHNGNIEIYYHCNFFSDPEGITYKYKLENYDFKWQEVPHNVRSIKYAQLQAGEYIFEICAFNKQGAVTSVATVFYLNITPSFWQQWWFILLAAIVVVFLAFALFRIMKKRERAKAEIQQQILRLKADALAAQMNPHFVFNCISSINALINIGDKQTATLYLGRFATLLRSVLKSVRSNEISLEDELQMIENYMQLEQTRNSKPFNYSIKRTEGFSTTIILIPPLIIHPYVENSILHGFRGVSNVEKRIDILAGVSEGRLLVVIKDNGTGISSNMDQETGLGMKITKERISFLGSNANVQIASQTDESNHGTTVTLSIPLKINSNAK